MDLQFIEGIFSSFTKIGILFFLFLYIIFSIIVSKQVNSMTKTLEVGFEPALKSIATLHLIVSVCVFIYAMIVL